MPACTGELHQKSQEPKHRGWPEHCRYRDVGPLFHSLMAAWGGPVIVQSAVSGSDEYDVVGLGDGKGGLLGSCAIRKIMLTGTGKAFGGIVVADPALQVPLQPPPIASPFCMAVGFECGRLVALQAVRHNSGLSERTPSGTRTGVGAACCVGASPKLIHCRKPSSTRRYFRDP